MKKILTILLAMVLTLSLAFALVSCGGNREQDTETNTNTESETGTETGTDTESGTDQSSETDTESGNGKESDTEAESETDTDTEAQSNTDTEVESNTDTEAESDTDMATEVESETDTETESKPEHVHTEAVLVGKSATCKESGLTDGKYCTECEKILIKQEVIPTLAHSIEKVEAKAPTCVDKGWEAYEKCLSCDYTEYKEILPTGIHEKTNFEYGLIGGCGSAYVANVCDLCDNYEILSMSNKCQNQITVDKNTMTSKCKKCKMKIVMVSDTDFGCENDATVEITYNGEVVFKSDYIKYENHSNLDYEIIDLNNTFSCGVRLVVNKCYDCDKIIEIKASEHKGELIKSDVDKSTVSYECSVCSFKKLESVLTEDDCLNTTNKTVKIYNGNSLLYESDATLTNDNHNIETEYTLLDKSCKAGYLITYACKDCSYKSYDFGFEHFEKREAVSLEGVSACGGEYVIYKCTLCENTIDVGYFATNCYGESEYITETDENGKTVSIIIESCDTCDMVYEVKQYDETEFACTIKSRSAKKMQIGETVLYEIEVFYEDEMNWHDIESTYELLGDSCLDGVRETAVCKNGCGYESNHVYYYHTNSQANNIYFEASCEGTYISETYCPCNEYKAYYFSECQNATSSTEYYEENGTEYSLKTTECPDCGLIYTEKTFEEKDGCEICEKKVISISAGEDVYIDNVEYISYSYFEHENEKDAILFGESCTDGYININRCVNCDNLEWDVGSYHERYLVEEKEIVTSCGTMVISFHQCCCGESSYVNYDYDCNMTTKSVNETDKNGLINSYYLRQCDSCGLKIEESNVYGEPKNCKVDENHHIVVTYTDESGEEKTLEYSFVYWTEEYHRYSYTYDVVGSSCYNGVIETESCLDCDYVNTNEYSGHLPVNGNGYNIRFDYYGSEHGGEYRYGVCPCDEAVATFYFYTYNCDMSTTYGEEEIDGVLYNTKTDVCQGCGLTVITASYEETEGCYVYEYIIRTIKMGERTIVDSQNEKHLKEERHTNEITYKLYGESCNDGFDKISTCTVCGIERASYFDYHDYVYEYTSDNLSGQICNEHYFRLASCPCREDINIYVFDDMNEEGVFSCETCNLAIKKEIISTNGEGCFLSVTEKHSVILNDEVLYTQENTTELEKHSFEVTDVTLVDEIMVVESTCNGCEMVLESKIYRTNGFIEGVWGDEYLMDVTPENDGYYSIYTITTKSVYTIAYKNGDTYDLALYDNLMVLELFAGTTYQLGVGFMTGEPQDVDFAIVEGAVPKTSEDVASIADFTFEANGVTYVGQIRTDRGTICNIAVAE